MNRIKDSEAYSFLQLLLTMTVLFVAVITITESIMRLACLAPLKPTEVEIVDIVRLSPQGDEIVIYENVEIIDNYSNGLTFIEDGEETTIRDLSKLAIKNKETVERELNLRCSLWD